LADDVREEQKVMYDAYKSATKFGQKVYEIDLIFYLILYFQLKQSTDEQYDDLAKEWDTRKVKGTSEKCVTFMPIVDKK
jgi:hypothetical protein